MHNLMLVEELGQLQNQQGLVQSENPGFLF